MYPDRSLRKTLIPEFVDLDDSGIVAQAWALEAFDRAKIAEMAQGGGTGACLCGRRCPRSLRTPF